MNKYKTFIGFANYAAFLLAIISLPFHWRLANILLLFWLLLWVAEGRFFSKKNIRPVRQWLPAMLCLIPICLEILSFTWAADSTLVSAVVERHIGFMVLPLVAFFGVNEHYKSNTLLTTLIATSVVSVFYYLTALYWVENSNYVMFWTNELRPLAINDGGLTMQMKHKLFYSIILTASFAGLPFVYKHYRKKYARWQVVLTTTLAGGIIAAGVILTMSRAGTFTFIIVAGLTLLMQLKGRWRTLSIIFSVAFLLLFFAIHPRLNNIKSDPRTEEWRSAWNSRGNIPFYGKGAGHEVEFMIEAYENEGYEEGVRNRYGPHNQYISTTIDLGYIGLLILLALIVALPFIYTGKVRHLAVLVSLTYSITMLTDDVLLRIDPLFTLMIMLVILQTLQHEQDSAHPTSKPSQVEGYATENQ